MSIIFDVVTVGLILIIIISSALKGFVRSIFELCGYIASFIVASIFSVPLGNFLYVHIIKAPFYNGASEYISSLTGGAQQVFRQFLTDYHLSTQVLDNAAKSPSDAVNGAVMNGLVAPMGNLIGRGIAFVVIFFLCLFLVRILARVGDIINKLPVIGGLNRLLGAAVGIIKATIIMFLICTIIAVLI